MNTFWLLYELKRIPNYAKSLEKILLSQITEKLLFNPERPMTVCYFPEFLLLEVVLCETDERMETQLDSWHSGELQK